MDNAVGYFQPMLIRLILLFFSFAAISLQLYVLLLVFV